MPSYPHISHLRYTYVLGELRSTPAFYEHYKLNIEDWFTPNIPLDPPLRPSQVTANSSLLVSPRTMPGTSNISRAASTAINDPMHNLTSDSAQPSHVTRNGSSGGSSTARRADCGGRRPNISASSRVGVMTRTIVFGGRSSGLGYPLNVADQRPHIFPCLANDSETESADSSENSESDASCTHAMPALGEPFQLDVSELLSHRGHRYTYVLTDTLSSGGAGLEDDSDDSEPEVET